MCMSSPKITMPKIEMPEMPELPPLAPVPEPTAAPPELAVSTSTTKTGDVVKGTTSTKKKKTSRDDLRINPGISLGGVGGTGLGLGGI